MNAKICGLSEARHIDVAVKGGARYLGFVFFPKSPRNLSIEAARILMRTIPEHICKVALVVNPTDLQLDHITKTLPVDMLQLHGSESPQRVTEIKQKYHLPVMKAVGVSDAADLSHLNDYARVCDQLLVDAKPPKEATLPGGNGLAFDWRLIAERRWAVPWMLAGGLTADNVAQAAQLTGARQVDVSSGVESAPGVKSSEKIAAFLAAANGE